MTIEEYFQLDNTAIYAFHFYWGEVKYGYIVKESSQFYIINPNHDNRNKRASEIGFQVRLDTIEFWEKAGTSINNGVSVPTISIEEEHCDILIILGAGASFDFSFESILTKEDRPPLGYDLFSDIYEDIIAPFPGAESLSSEILKAKNIEDYFQKQWNKVISTNNPILLSKLINTQYYLRNLFHKISSKCIQKRKNNYNILVQQLYDSLIEKSSKEKAIFVTFNYDTLLEQSISQTIGYDFNKIDDYINFKDNRFLVIKPHGSWNWGKKINKKLFEENKIEPSENMYAVGNIFYKRGLSQHTLNKYLESNTEVVETNNPSWQNQFFPNLLIPFSKKDEFVMPQNHKAILETFLPNIKKIISIGWKGTELAFQKLLQKHLCEKNIDIIHVNMKDESFEKEMKAFLPNAIFKSFAPYKESKGSFSEFAEYILEYQNTIY